MPYQIQNIVPPPPGMTFIRDFRAYVVVALAIFVSTQRGEDETFCVPLLKSDFEDRQVHKPKTREEVLNMLPEKLLYNDAIYKECQETSDIASVRFDYEATAWTVGPRPWSNPPGESNEK